MQEGPLLMTQADRDRLVTLKKAKKKLITQREAAEECHFQENFLFDSSARGTCNFMPFYTAQVSTTAAGVVNAVTGA